MVEHMKLVATGADDELTLDERNLLAVAYKNVIGTRRASWRVLAAIENKHKLTDNSNGSRGGSHSNASAVRAYRQKVERELTELCAEMLALVDKRLLPATTSHEGRVFFDKTRGDYYRYLAEIQVDHERSASAQRALEAYKQASATAMAELSPTHPLRLGLALNFSVFYYDILASPAQACGLAKRAFDDAIAELDALSDDSYRDATLIMQLLRDNLSLWLSEDNDDDNGDDEADEPTH